MHSPIDIQLSLPPQPVDGRSRRSRSFASATRHSSRYCIGGIPILRFGVAQRTQELGVRMALGARRSHVLRLVMKEGTIVAVIGAAIGLGGAYLVGRAMQSTLYWVGAMDGLAIGGTAALLLVVAGLACLIPALRASRVEPMVALRNE